ncbi:hypothetical protein HC928_16490 [bacterium]|nr:hypothetical protein [bacterium]
MHDSQLWTLAQDAAYAFCPTYDMAMRAVVKDVGLQYMWFPLYIARGIHPAPLSLDKLANIRPHYTTVQQQTALDALTAQGYLSARDGAYALTPQRFESYRARVPHRSQGTGQSQGPAFT